MVNLLIFGQTATDLTSNPRPVRTVYDPAAGTGGMLMTAMAHLKELNPAAIVSVFGQELNDETWAIAQSDLMMQIADADPDQFRRGNTLTQDAFRTEKFDVILANPPFPRRLACWPLGCGRDVELGTGDVEAGPLAA